MPCWCCNGVAVPTLGPPGANEEFTLVNGKLCSTTLMGEGSFKRAHAGAAVCLKSNSTKPGHSGGGGGSGDGFLCGADAAALARCQVHFTMWTIMKAPLLLGNNIPKMDQPTLDVVLNKAALSISQDALGVQAQRVWANTSASFRSGVFDPQVSVAAVAALCDASRPTQQWRHHEATSGALATTAADGSEWCLHSFGGAEEVGSWRAVRCASVPGAGGARLGQRALGQTPGAPASTTVAFVTPLGGHLVWDNALGASGPVPHTRYLAVDNDRSATSSWIRESVGKVSVAETDAVPPFRLMAADRANVRDDNKAGKVTTGGDFCLDLAADGDSEVWAGPLAENKWAVALLNRDPTTKAAITVDYTMFNSTAVSVSYHPAVAKAIHCGSHTPFKARYSVT
jgi:hypothetical protein